jgi:hypothetical protein
MLAIILKSPQPTQTTISIIEAYSKIMNLTKNINELTTIQNEKKKKI